LKNYFKRAFKTDGFGGNIYGTFPYCRSLKKKKKTECAQQNVIQEVKNPMGQP
jgi:hypothetical protein